MSARERNGVTTRCSLSSRTSGRSARIRLSASAWRRAHSLADTGPLCSARPAAAGAREDVNAPRLRVEGAPDGVAEHLRVRVAVQHRHVRGGGIADDAFAGRRRPEGRGRTGAGTLIARCGESGEATGEAPAGAGRRESPAAKRARSSRMSSSPGRPRDRRSRSATADRRSRAGRCEPAWRSSARGSMADRGRRTRPRGRRRRKRRWRDSCRASVGVPAGLAPESDADPPPRPLDEVEAERRHGERDQQDQQPHRNRLAHCGVEGGCEHDERPVPQVDGVRDAAEEAKRREAERAVREREPVGDASDDQQRSGERSGAARPRPGTASSRR